MKSFFQKKNREFWRKGTSIVEMIIYIFILTLILFVIITIISSISSSQRRFASTKAIEMSSMYSLERIVREIRNASSTNPFQSNFGTHPGVLTLNSIDNVGNPRTVSFSLQDGAIHVYENGVDAGPITEKTVIVHNLVFRSIDTANSQGIKIDITLQSGADKAFREEVFSATAALRGSY